jgi:hypothetical protein
VDVLSSTAGTQGKQWKTAGNMPGCDRRKFLAGGDFRDFSTVFRLLYISNNNLQNGVS